MESHKKLFLETLEKLGLLVNFDKSALNPSMVARFIGYDICTGPDLDFPVIKIPAERVRKLQHDINRALRSDSLSARYLARICGQLYIFEHCNPL